MCRIQDRKVQERLRKGDSREMLADFTGQLYCPKTALRLWKDH